MNLIIEKKHSDLAQHPMYKKLDSLENIRTFMQYHIFAVWDFMTLLKSLQRKVTCIDLPWVKSNYNSELVRLVNEIVLAEESDVDQNGKAASHFELYLKAMKEVGADTQPIEEFLSDFDLTRLPSDLAQIVSFHLDLALNGKVHEVASSFFYGREKIIPEMFESILNVMQTNNLECPTLVYYLKRHIELDGDEHGPKAQQCLLQLTDTKEKKDESLQVALLSLEKRWELWDFINLNI